MEKRDDRKANYKVADQRSPRHRERDLLDAARAEGRPQPADGSRPLSAAHPERKGKGEGGLKHIVETGLPPGIDEQDAKDPGTGGNTGRPADNRS